MNTKYERYRKNKKYEYDNIINESSSKESSSNDDEDSASLCSGFSFDLKQKRILNYENYDNDEYDNYDSDDDDNDDHIDDFYNNHPYDNLNLQKFAKQPLYEHSNIMLVEFVIAFLLLLDKLKLSKQSIDILIKFVRVILPSDNIVPKTFDKLLKYLKSNPLTSHMICCIFFGLNCQSKKC